MANTTIAKAKSELSVKLDPFSAGLGLIFHVAAININADIEACLTARLESRRCLRAMRTMIVQTARFVIAMMPVTYVALKTLLIARGVELEVELPSRISFDKETLLL